MWLATVAESGQFVCRPDEQVLDLDPSCSGTELGGSADNQE